MCGRFYVDEKIVQDIQRIVREVDLRMNIKAAGDVFPSQEALVLMGGTQGLQSGQMYWGFAGYDQKRLLINARAETALERRTFRESVLHRRCAVPARHFYEWDPGKNKVSFRRQDAGVIYMAGFYQSIQGKDRFIILTTKANASIKAVHDRMPLILDEPELKAWITEDDSVKDILQKDQPELESFQEYEQQRLPF